MDRKLKPDIAERNIALSGQIMHYLLKHPQVFDVLPDDFELVILPEDDLEVTMFNLELLRKRGRQGNHCPGSGKIQRRKDNLATEHFCANRGIRS